MTPEEAVRAADDMGVKSMILTHVGKFCISAHSWDEPFNRVVEASQGKDFRLLTPKIGKPIRLDGAEQSFSRWWEDIN